jgi:hypothetical protein
MKKDCNEQHQLEQSLHLRISDGKTSKKLMSPHDDSQCSEK